MEGNTSITTDSLSKNNRSTALPCGLPRDGNLNHKPHPLVGRVVDVLFNYTLKLLYLGCQWKELLIEKTEKVDQRSTTAEFTVPFADLKPRGALMRFLPGLCRCCIGRVNSISASSTAMERRQQQRKGAIISDTTGTETQTCRALKSGIGEKGAGERSASIVLFL